MVMVIMKWDILPDKAKEYTDWAKSAVQRQLAVPGVKEFRAYRPVSGSHQAVVTYEFDNFAEWETWRNNWVTGSRPQPTSPGQLACQPHPQSWKHEFTAWRARWLRRHVGPDLFHLVDH